MEEVESKKSKVESWEGVGVGNGGIGRLMKPVEVWGVLGMGRSTVYRMLASGEIPSVRVKAGARRVVRRVRPEALLEWMRGREGGEAAKPGKGVGSGESGEEGRGEDDGW